MFKRSQIVRTLVDLCIANAYYSATGQANDVAGYMYTSSSNDAIRNTYSQKPLESAPYIRPKRISKAEVPQQMW